MRLVRFTLVLVALLLSHGLAPGGAGAQTPMLGTGGTSGTTAMPGTPVKADFTMRLLRNKGDNEWSVFSDFEQKYYFNSARCQCDTNVRLELFFSSTGAAKKTLFTQSKATIEVLIGDAGCLAVEQATVQAADCRVLGSFSLSSFAQRTDRPTYDFVASKLYARGGQKCTAQGTQSIRLRIDTNADGITDLTGDTAPSLSVEFDGEPPAAPDEGSIQVTGGNEALQASWTQTERSVGFAGYSVFCSRGEDLSVFQPSYYSSQFYSKATVCGGNTAATGQLRVEKSLALTSALDVALASTGGSGGSAGGTGGASGAGKAEGPFDAPAPFRNLDPAFVCSDLLKTQQSARITGLQNGIPYLIGVSAIDLHGNASPITKVFLQKPIPTRDFFNGYREANGEGMGGFCAMTGGRPRTGGVLPLLGLALGGLGARAVARRRKRR